MMTNDEALVERCFAFHNNGRGRRTDFAWRDQTGAPDDPQPGNIPGGARDVLRSAGFDGANSAAGTGFFADSGTFTASGGELQVAAASLGGDAVSVFNVAEQLPLYFEIQASVKMTQATGGWKANAYVVFDYQGEQDFKFVGIDDSTNKLVMGHRDASGWHVDVQGVVTGGVKPGKSYNMLIAINGVNVTLVVDNKQVFQHTFAPRVIDGYAYGLNWGMVGVGSDNARGSYDNVRVQILPPQVTFDDTDDFSGADTREYFTGGTTGAWGVSGGRYSVSGDGMSLLDLGPDNLNHNAYLELSAKLSTQDRAGFVFDRYGSDAFKFVAIDADTQQLLIGHYTDKSGWVVDSAVATAIDGTKDYTLGLTLKGSTVSATLGGANGGFQAIAGHVFNASTVDGNFGLMAQGGGASFDDVRVKTDDRALEDGGTDGMVAADGELTGGAGDVLTQSELDAIADVAISLWTDALGDANPLLAGLADVRFDIADLTGAQLGSTEGNTVVIDADAAGYGWFVDGSPTDSKEFALRMDRNVLAAALGTAAYGRMDLLTVVTHEIGHLLGFGHEDEAAARVMDDDLEAGVRYLLEKTGFDADPDAPISDAMLKELAAQAVAFDLGTGDGAGGSVDWQAGAAEGWTATTSPATAKGNGKDSGNFSDYLVMAPTSGASAEQTGYDSLGNALLGKGKGKGK
jgi:hypothetical protein